MDVAPHILILIKHVFIAICALSSIYLLTLNAGVSLDKRYEVTRLILSYVMVPMPIYYSIKFYLFGSIGELPYLFSLNTLFAGSVAFSILSALTEHFFKIEEFRIGRLFRTFLSTIVFLVFYTGAQLLEDDVRSFDWLSLWESRYNLPQGVRMAQSVVLIGNIIYFATSFFRKRDEYLAELTESELARGRELAQWASHNYSFVLVVFFIMVSTLFSSNLYLFSFFVLSVGVAFLSQTIRCFNFFSRWSIRTSDSLSVESEVFIQNDRLPQLIEESMRMHRYYAIPGIAADDVAQKIGIPRHKLNTYLKVVLNVNFNQWIQMQRIEEAKTILDVDIDLSLSDLALSLGYRDPAMFSRNFKLIVGLSPREYRKNMKEQIAIVCDDKR